METHARLTDPITSHLAAAENAPRRPAQVEMVTELVEAFPGLTSQELAQQTGEDRYMLARRLPDAERKHLVTKAEPRMCHVSNRMAVTWKPITGQGDLF
jgi:hypothetical protein